MGRRSEHSREELQTMVVDAALQLVQEHGASKVTARAIAKAVGYTPGMLYSLFRNQRDIFLHVNQRNLAVLFKRCMAARAVATSPRDAIDGMGLAYLRYAREHGNAFELLFSPLSAPSSDDQAPEALSLQIGELFGLIEAQLEQLSPSADRYHLRTASRALWSGVHGAAALAANQQLYLEGDCPEERVASDLIRHYLDNFEASSRSA